ncbi:Clp protease N-terminal domain-containing protein [Hyphomicrobium sp.]|uniref:Clp protease N-terminal domain-containing protein n=1 Tax=Hyphomicrobium sp. TaxID=82 RepID=UPI0025C47881|nr:Clp protease N-terminal domain-containing protein [Hyphomicrobium sp.]MCC7253403.1 hypothetical protein [Hyphomicrobium sp.]
MGYRGDDLDLRTPQATPGDLAISQPADPFVASARARATASAARGAPIWVDDALLDCCNHAYDVASAHRATEVRVEHLIYALTRIDEAADLLEARGVRTAGLRREAATAIATEIPAAHGSGKTNPRRAEAVEEILRLAAALAYRRQAPAGVADLVHVLLEGATEFSPLLRLFPPTARPAESTLDVEAYRERYRNGPAASYPPRVSTADVATANQHARIDAIEQSLRTLTIELANERKFLSGVLQDLQRELMAQREDTSRLGGITQEKIQAVFGDRLQSLEQAFHSRAPNGDLGALQDRLGLLERALQAEISVTRAAVESLAEKPATDIGPLLRRLETVEAAERTLSGSVQALAAAIERQPGEISASVSSPIIEHLNALTVTRDAQHAAQTDGLAETHRRLGALEEALATHAARASQERAELRELLERIAERNQEGFATLAENITQDLSEVHDGLSRVHSDHHALATTLDSEAQGAANAFASLAARIDILEKAAGKPIEMLEALSATVDKMHKVTVERYYRRNRFWYWLFGTDDWLAASWPSQSARIAEELRAVKR